MNIEKAIEFLRNNETLVFEAKAHDNNTIELSVKNGFLHHVNRDAHGEFENNNRSNFNGMVSMDLDFKLKPKEISIGKALICDKQLLVKHKNLDGYKLDKDGNYIDDIMFTISKLDTDKFIEVIKDAKWYEVQ